MMNKSSQHKEMPNCKQITNSKQTADNKCKDIAKFNKIAQKQFPLK